MRELNEPVPDSDIVNTVEGALALQKNWLSSNCSSCFYHGWNRWWNPHDEYQLTEIAELGLKYSPVTQCLIEKSIAGF